MLYLSLALFPSLGPHRVDREQDFLGVGHEQVLELLLLLQLRRHRL